MFKEGRQHTCECNLTGYSFSEDYIFPNSIKTFAKIWKTSDWEDSNLYYDDCLTISTIHSAKGLEWDSVFIIGAVDGRFPSAYSFNSEEELDEELRLMYVATTRAKNNLYITYPVDMYDYSMNMVLSKPRLKNLLVAIFIWTVSV